MFWIGFLVGVIVTLIVLPQLAKLLLPWFLKKKASKIAKNLEEGLARMVPKPQVPKVDMKHAGLQ